MIKLDIMTTRALFIISFLEKQLKSLHGFELMIERRQVGYEIARSEYCGMTTDFQTDINITDDNPEWKRFEEDIKELRPMPNENYTIMDYLHSWDWAIFHKLKKSDYNFQKHSKKKRKGLFNI